MELGGGMDCTGIAGVGRCRHGLAVAGVKGAACLAFCSRSGSFGLLVGIPGVDGMAGSWASSAELAGR